MLHGCAMVGSYVFSLLFLGERKRESCRRAQESMGLSLRLPTYVSPMYLPVYLCRYLNFLSLKREDKDMIVRTLVYTLVFLRRIGMENFKRGPKIKSLQNSVVGKDICSLDYERKNSLTAKQRKV